ncbi:MAG: FtsW/RodA/SpoVE family cell cycle protein [Anaerolineae bacterium]
MIATPDVVNQPSDSTRPIEAAPSWWTITNRSVDEGRLLLLAGAFVFVGLCLLGLVNQRDANSPIGAYQIAPGLLIAAFVTWAVCFAGLHRQLDQHQRDRDAFILPIVALLSGWGLIEIARLAPGFLPRQLLWLVVSTAAFIFISRTPTDLKWLRRYRYTWLLIGLVLLALTFIIGVNPEGVGLTLWLGGILGVFFQPSEMLKLLFVAFLASYLAEKREIAHSLGPTQRARYLTLPYLAPLIAMWAVSMLLLIAQQELGSSLLLYFSFLVMLFLASGKRRYLAVGAVLLVVAAVAGYLLIGRVRGRIDTWLNPWADAAGSSYQVVQSLIALNTGGVIGTGLGQGYPEVILPAAHTDMPLAAIGEEFGLAGTLAVVACYTALTLRGLRIAATARTTFGRLLAAGLATSLGLQAWIIMAGNAGLAPLTGVTLPFISYGGSSLLMSFIEIGLLLHIAADRD